MTGTGRTNATIRGLALALAMGLGLAAGCGDGEPRKDAEPSRRHAATAQAQDHEHVTGPHGGELITVEPGKVRVEFLHDAGAGTVEIHVLRGTAPEPLEIDAAPAINLKTPEGPRQIPCQAVAAAEGAASHFRAEDASLKADPLEGQIAISVDGKDYFPAIPHGHQGHQH